MANDETGFSCYAFLDFDGVLHAPNCRASALFASLPRLEEVLRDFPDVGIVISSSWRQGRNLDKLRGPFAQDMKERVVGSTPLLPYQGHAAHRGLECTTWLEAKAPGTPVARHRR